jgi:DNA (cytosine-5)-methyltransferase 1
MKHLGDITKISGYTAPIVDCIIGGSPCQDLSVAGKRAGLDGERSGLYIEQVRIVKEMRARDESNGRTGVDIRPRYMVWENVPGAFSSNKGDDFRIVLEELAKVKDKNAVIPMPEKWTNYGCIMGDGWSIAWRVLDAQFWGVPQRRRRIALVADFGGQSAPEILFVRKSVSGHTDESKQKRQEASPDVTGGFGADDCIGYDGYNGELTGGKASTLSVNCGISTGRNGVITFEPGIASREGGHIYEGVSGTLRANAGDNQMATAYTLKIRSGCEGGGKGALVQTDKSATLATNNDQYLFQPVYSVENHPNDSRVGINEDGIVQALTSRMGTGGGNVPMVLALDRASYNQGKNASYDFEVSDKGVNSPLVAKGPGAVCYALDQQGGKGGANFAENVSPTICSDSHGTPHAVCYSVGQGGGKSACNVMEGQAPTLTCTHGGEPAVCFAVDCRNGTEDTVNGALQSNSAHSLNGNNVVRTRYIVRRLTPLECERLQGYPDGWTDIGEWTDSNGKKRQTSDAARYKALGNSIALPPWKWVLKRLCACYERDATMASLFDGIGGFPYLWEQLNGKGTCLWASEIEEFPIAVTKVRIGG